MVNALTEIDGVLGGEVYKSASLSKFPKCGSNGTNYGRHFSVRDISALQRFCESLLGQVGSSQDLSLVDDLADIDASDRGATEKWALKQARIGQGAFRQQLIAYWGGCAVSEIQNPALLRASHIKPWSRCSDSERMDPFNGLLLNATFDAAFDSGLITFDDDGNMAFSQSLSQDDSLRCKFSGSEKLSRIEDKHRAFLSFHRAHIFQT